MKKRNLPIFGILLLIAISILVLKPSVPGEPPHTDAIAQSVNPVGDTPVENVIYKDKVVAVVFHYLDPKEIPGVGISPERFAGDLDMLQAKGYHVISLEQLRQFLKGGAIPDNAVLITFDDGYESNYKYAFPELKKRDMPAVNFAIVSYINKKIGALQYLSWYEIDQMNAAGFITQSHTYNMHKTALLANGRNGPLLSGPLKGQTKNQFAAAVFQDLKRSKDETESHLHQTVYALALPYDVANNDAINAATKAGIELIFTGKAGAISRNSNPLSLPRIIGGDSRISASDLDEWIRKVTK